MRVIVFFDLPTLSAEDRREYAKFRKFLIKGGFLMMQESVYTKMALNKTVADSVVESVKRNKPPKGLVQLMTITEKQFNRMEYVCGEFVTDVLCTDERLVSDIEAYMYELDWELEYETKVNEIDMKNIIKLGIGGIDKKENLVERFDDYVKISSRVLHNKVLVLFGMSGWFDTDEWKQIQRTAMYEEMYLLCIENRDVFVGENKIVIDFDGCRVI